MFCLGDSVLKGHLAGKLPVEVLDDVVKKCKTTTRFEAAVNGLIAKQYSVLKKAFEEKSQKFTLEDSRVIDADKKLFVFEKNKTSLENNGVLHDDSLTWLKKEAIVANGWFNWTMVGDWWLSADDSAPNSADAFAEEMFQCFQQRPDKKHG